MNSDYDGSQFTMFNSNFSTEIFDAYISTKALRHKIS